MYIGFRCKVITYYFPFFSNLRSGISSQWCWGGQGGGRPGEKGVGEEWARSGIPKVAGSGRKREKLCNILCNILQSKTCKEVEANKYRAGTRIKGYGNGEVLTPLPPPPTMVWLNLYNNQAMQFSFCALQDSCYQVLHPDQHHNWRAESIIALCRILGHFFLFAQNCLNFCMWPSLHSYNIAKIIFSLIFASFSRKTGRKVKSVLL